MWTQLYLKAHFRAAHMQSDRVNAPAGPEAWRDKFIRHVQGLDDLTGSGDGSNLVMRWVTHIQSRSTAPSKLGIRNSALVAEETTSGDLVDLWISNLHTSILHSKVGSFCHGDEESCLHHALGWDAHTHKYVHSNVRTVSQILPNAPGIILIAAFTSFHLWALSNFQSRMKLLLSVTTGPWEFSQTRLR